LNALLRDIVLADQRLNTLDPTKAAELLRSHPALEGILKEAWDKREFKEVRRLGAFSRSHPGPYYINTT
jgi:hypothetical protein